MSGICGWFSTTGTAVPPANIIAAMARTLHSPLAGQTAQYASVDYGLAAATLRREGGAVFRDDDLLVGFEGTPYFDDTALRNLAAGQGVAAAIAENYKRRGTACLTDIHGPSQASRPQKAKVWSVGSPIGHLHIFSVMVSTLATEPSA